MGGRGQIPTEASSLTPVTINGSWSAGTTVELGSFIP